MRIQKRRPLLNRSERVFCEGVFMMLQQPEQEQEEEEAERKSLRTESFPSPKTGDRSQLDTINIQHPSSVFSDKLHLAQIDPPLSSSFSSSSSSAISGVSSPPAPLLSLEYAWSPNEGRLKSLSLSKDKTVNSSTAPGDGCSCCCPSTPLSIDVHQQKCYLGGFDLNLSLSCTPQTREFATFARPPFYTFTELFKGTRGGLEGTENMNIRPSLGFETESELMLNQMGTDEICRSVQKLPANKGFSSCGNGTLDLEGKGEGKEQCRRKDGRGWQCSRRVKEDCTYCEHHLLKIRANHARSAMKMALLRKITKTKKKKKKKLKLEDCHFPPPPPLLNHFL